MSDLIGPLIGVAVGWFLKEITEVLRLRREGRMAIGRALADILEIQHHFISVKMTTDEISKRVQLPPDAHIFLRQLVQSFVPNLESLHKRYEESVNRIASADPLLGFRLRSQDSLGPMLNQLRTIVQADGEALSILSKMEIRLIDLTMPHFDKLIRELAWLHGPKTWLRIYWRSKRPLKIPTELEEMLSWLPKVEEPK